MEEIIKREGKVERTEKKIRLYNTLLKSVLPYNLKAWGQPMNGKIALNSFNTKQLHKVIEVQSQTKMIKEKSYEVAKTRPLTIKITKPRWKLLSLVLRLNESQPVRTAVKYLFIKPFKEFRERKRSTIVTTLNRHIGRTKKEFKYST